jgi:hypothetical protein
VREARARLRFSVTSAIAPHELQRLEECLGNWRAPRHEHAAAGCA